MIENLSLEKELILIVDDNLNNLKVLLGFLKQFGFGISIAQSSEEMFKLLNRFTPDIILLDVMMSGLDGFEACRRLKTAQATCEVPVIFMTALSDVENKVKGFEAGGVDYITKPVEYQEVVARLTTHLTLRNLQKRLSQKNAELQAKNEQLQQALDQVKRLNGLLPICANCKQIRDDTGYWHDVVGYIQDHSEAEFTHGICPNCMKKLYPEFFEGE